MRKKSKKWKSMLLTWACIYPTINFILYLIGPYINEYHQLVRTFILTLILVPLMAKALDLLLNNIQGLNTWLNR